LNVQLDERRKVLGELFETVRGGKTSPLKLSETIEAKPAELVRLAKEFGFEGIVAKRRDSYYEPASEAVRG
jgi:ATP-dependent DNA ligase